MSKRLLTLSLGLLLFSACTPAEKDAMESLVDSNDTMMNDDDSDSMMKDESSDAMMKKDEGMRASEGTMMENNEAAAEGASEDTRMRSMYSLYAPQVLMNGQTKIIFFHAAWCPACRKADDTLRELYNRGDDLTMSFDELMEVLPQYSTYKVDYDTEKDLRAKYGVTYQHTFVLVDGQGNALKTVQGPSDDVLKSMIGAQ